MITSRSSLATTAAMALVGNLAMADTTTTITGTHALSGTGLNEYRLFEIDSGTLFASPTDDQPVTVTGSVDVSALGGGSVVFVGLMAKDRYDAWRDAGHDPASTADFGFAETAYALILPDLIGLGQLEAPAETVQNYLIEDGVDLFTDFSVTFGTSSFSLDWGGESISLDYKEHWNELAGGASVATDFTNGAYAFVGTQFVNSGGSHTVDVTFTQVPEPASVALLAMGGGTALMRRRPQ